MSGTSIANAAILLGTCVSNFRSDTSYGATSRSSVPSRRKWLKENFLLSLRSCSAISGIDWGLFLRSYAVAAQCRVLT
eukprot:2550813-Rhodomonas_salina.5